MWLEIFVAVGSTIHNWKLPYLDSAKLNNPRSPLKHHPLLFRERNSRFYSYCFITTKFHNFMLRTITQEQRPTCEMNDYLTNFYII
jgi:hypothetical protein